jgi:hypothetical protein
MFQGNKSLSLLPASAGFLLGLLFNPEDGDSRVSSSHMTLQPRGPYSSVHVKSVAWLCTFIVRFWVQHVGFSSSLLHFARSLPGIIHSYWEYNQSSHMSTPIITLPPTINIWGQSFFHSWTRIYRSFKTSDGGLTLPQQKTQAKTFIYFYVPSTHLEATVSELLKPLMNVSGVLTEQSHGHDWLKPDPFMVRMSLLWSMFKITHNRKA